MLRYSFSAIGKKSQLWLDEKLHKTHKMEHFYDGESVEITFHTENKLNGLTQKQSTYLVFYGNSLFMCSFPSLESAQEWATKENINELLDNMSWY